MPATLMLDFLKNLLQPCSKFCHLQQILN